MNDRKLKILENQDCLTLLEKREFKNHEDLYETFKKHWECGDRLVVSYTVDFKNVLIREPTSESKRMNRLFRICRGIFEGRPKTDPWYFYLEDCFDQSYYKGSRKVIDIKGWLSKKYYSNNIFAIIRSLDGIELVGCTPKEIKDCFSRDCSPY